MDNVIVQMLQKQFFLMFVPRHDVIHTKIYSQKLNIEYTEDVEVYTNAIRQNKIVVFENALGSFVFANIRTFDIFQILQKKHKDVCSYVFCADSDFGYFKILEQGRITRKVASFGHIDGISSYPETRGAPCQFEIEKKRIFKIDGKAIYLVDMLKTFTQKEVTELLDYYIGLSAISEAGVEQVNVYILKDYDCCP